MSWTRREVGDLDGAIEAASRALEIAVTLGDAILQAMASYRLGQAFFSKGDPTRAAELFRGNLEAAGAPDVAPFGVSTESRAWLAQVLSLLGDFAEGRRHGEEAVRLAAVKQGPSPIIAHGCLGILHLANGDLEVAIRVLEPGLALCRAADERGWSNTIAGALGEAYGRSGRLAEGTALVEAAFRDAGERGALNSQLGIAERLSAVHLLAGRLAEARQHARQALDLARHLKARGAEAGALIALGEIHTCTGPAAFQQAEATYREALALAEARGMRPLVAHCHLGLGTLYRRTGECEQAQHHLTAATAMYREMGMRFRLEQVEAEMKEWA